MGVLLVLSSAFVGAAWYSIGVVLISLPVAAASHVGESSRACKNRQSTEHNRHASEGVFIGT
jgi:hypothetical protein